MKTKLNCAHSGVVICYLLLPHYGCIKYEKFMKSWGIFFFLLQVQTTFGRKMVCGRCWCGCPSWLLGNKVWSRSSENTGPSLDGTTTAGKSSHFPYLTHYILNLFISTSPESDFMIPFSQKSRSLASLPKPTMSPRPSPSISPPVLLTGYHLFLF